MKRIKSTKQIKNTLIVAVIALCSMPALAALPPQFQNLKDLNVMVNFAKQHEAIMNDLRNIDILSKTVTYGYYDGKKTRDCTASFTRKPVTYKGVGPAGELVFDKSDCPITWK